MSRIGERAAIFRNTSPARNHWLALRLRGRRSNRDGIGAMVHVVPARRAPAMEPRDDGGGLWLRRATARYSSEWARTAPRSRLKSPGQAARGRRWRNVAGDRYLTVEEP